MGMLEDALRAYAKFEDRSTDPTTPPSGEGLVYFKDGKLHSRDDAGTVVEYGAGGGGGSFSGAAVKLTSDQSGFANGTPTAIVWDAADFDVGSLTDIGGANPSRLTVSAGKWAASGAVLFGGIGNETVVRVSIAVNGTQVRERGMRTSGTGGSQGSIIYDVLDLSAGDFVEFMVEQLSGSSQTVLASPGSGNTSTFASLVKVG